MTAGGAIDAVAEAVTGPVRHGTDDPARLQLPVSLDPTVLARAFPILARLVHDKRLVYLDSAASAQKPRAVLDAMQAFYERSYANVHRGVHALSEEATVAFEAARATVARFVNASSPAEIVFVGNATEAINLVAATLGRSRLVPGDEVVLSELEHHANIVPWQLLQQARGVVLRVVPIEDDGTLRADRFAAAIGPRTRLVAVTHASNVLGTLTPLAEIARVAHAAGALVLADGCQAVPHQPIDVQALDVDFYAFSGHKLYGPTGIGVLYGKAGVLAELPPWQGGGEMISRVSFAGTTFKPPPHRFEAGTPPIAEAIGLAAAIGYVEALGFAVIDRIEREIWSVARARLMRLPGVRVLGPADYGVPVLSVVIEGVHPHDAATILDRCGVAVRGGHHCAQPLMQRLGQPGTLRPSFAFYNTAADVDALIEAVERVQRVFR